MPAQPPLTHASLVVQALPSLHVVPSLFKVYAQPPATGLQLATRQGPGLTQIFSVPKQPPPAHASPSVHGLPSSQGPLASVCTQPVAGSQLSAEHGLPSSQLAALPVQVPSEQASARVQASLSLQMPPVAGV